MAHLSGVRYLLCLQVTESVYRTTVPQLRIFYCMNGHQQDRFITSIYQQGKSSAPTNLWAHFAYKPLFMFLVYFLVDVLFVSLNHHAFIGTRDPSAPFSFPFQAVCPFFSFLFSAIVRYLGDTLQPLLSINSFPPPLLLIVYCQPTL